MSDKFQTIVQSELTDEVIHAVGNYVQLCARIENLVLEAIIIVEKPESSKETARVAELSRQRSTELISSLRCITDSLDQSHPWFDFFSELRGYLHRFVDHRHIAIHGVLSGKAELSVRHFDKKSGSILTSEVTQETVREMLEHADCIVRGLQSFCAEAKQQGLRNQNEC